MDFKIVPEQRFFTEYRLRSNNHGGFSVPWVFRGYLEIADFPLWWSYFELIFRFDGAIFDKQPVKLSASLEVRQKRREKRCIDFWKHTELAEQAG